MTRILLTGSTGQIGWELKPALAPLGEVIIPDRRGLDLADPDSIRGAMREARPDIVVNAAAFTGVDGAEAEPELAARINGLAPGVMAEEAKRLGALLIHYSTDYVFDGRSAAPYTEGDPPNPLNAYARSKLEGENAITACGGAYLILRTSWIYSARRVNFLLTILRLARQKKELPVVRDQIGSPTWARSLAQATARIAGSGRDVGARSGVYHVSAMGYTARDAFAVTILEMAAELSGVRTGWAAVRPTTTAEYPLPAARPLNTTTSKDKIERAFGIALPDWKSQLHSCLGEFAGAGIWREILAKGSSR